MLKIRIMQVSRCLEAANAPDFSVWIFAVLRKHCKKKGGWGWDGGGWWWWREETISHLILFGEKGLNIVRQYGLPLMMISQVSLRIR